jgi:hypothetical protein
MCIWTLEGVQYGMLTDIYCLKGDLVFIVLLATCFDVVKVDFLPRLPRTQPLNAEFLHRHYSARLNVTFLIQYCI